MNPSEESRGTFRLSPAIAMTDLMAAWPQVIPLLLDRRMACVGCCMARFETLADAAAIYGMDLERLLSDLERAIEHTELTEEL